MRIIAILSLFFVISCGSQQSKKEYVIDTAKPLVERIKLADLDGKEISLASLKGKTVFLNFWATWCKPCVKEMPSMDKAYKELQGDDFVFLAASDEGIERIRKSRLARNSISCPLVKTLSGRVP
jgi:thiol-disulfide isomerase/thioredoxin